MTARSGCRALLVLALTVMWSVPVQAQEVTRRVEGVVIDAVTGSPVTGATIRVTGQAPVVTALGSFALELPPGDWGVTVSAPGYSDAVERLVVEEGAVNGIRIALRRLTVTERVRVVAEGDPEESTASLQSDDVFRVAGSLDNVFRTLQTLPGVAAPEDFSGRLSVRGGGPDQNLTVMDGVEIHNPYRLFGIVSAFNPETVDRFELTAGGFGARYGDRLSSLLLVENRPGSPILSGSATASVTDANFVLEGALPGPEGSSWLLTGRRTYYDLVASQVSDNDFPAFGDLQLRLDRPIGQGTLTMTALRSREGADLRFDDEAVGDSAAALTDASNDLYATRYVTAIGERTLSTTAVSWYRNRDFLNFNGTFRNESRRANTPDDSGFLFSDVIFRREVLVEDLSFRQEVESALGSRHLVNFGIELHDLRSATSFESLGDRNNQEANGSSVRGGAGLPDFIESELAGVRGGVWVEDTIDFADGLRVTPGLRLDWSRVNGRATVTPRLAAEARIDPRTRLRAAGGLYTQSPGYEKLLQADYFIDLGSAPRDIRHQRALHAIVGVRRELGAGFQLSVEGYYKRFSDLVVGRLETESEQLERLGLYAFPDELYDSVPVAPIITSNPGNDGRGRAWGLDVFLAKRPTSSRGLYGWLSYTFGRAEQEAYGRVYPFDYDRRHSVSLVLAHRAGRKWEIGVTARAASGFPRTPPLGLRVDAFADPAHDPASTDPARLVPAVDAAGNLVYTVDYGDVANLNSARLPYYARLDARVTYRPGGAAGRWEVYLEVLNALNRDNAGALEPSLRYNPEGVLPILVESPEQALPLLPSFGVRFRF